ncbi:MAG: hypothetical protein HZB23_14215 [Deltaproteobacteria bacterium]|nr:hypothetical protein [Deltaproteobacteria bacterium]
MSRTVNKEFHYESSFNFINMRDIEHPLRKAPYEYRIAALGDSFTEGVGVAQDQTWPRLLQKMLPSVNGLRTRVMNCGIVSHDTVDELQVLRERVLAFRPDMVIVAVNSSDITDIATKGGQERIGRPFYRPPGSPWWEFLFGSSFLVRHFVQGILGYDWTLKSSAELKAGDARALDAIYQTIMDFAHLSGERGFALVAVFHPMKHELEKGGWPLDGLIGRLAGEKDILVVNLLEYYKAECAKSGVPASDIYWPVDLHHNARGYELFARGVAEAISKTPGIKN